MNSARGQEDVPVGLDGDLPQDVLPEGGQPGAYVRVLDGGVELPVEEDEEPLDPLVVVDQGVPDAGLGVGFLGQLGLEVAEDAPAARGSP